MRQYTVAGPLDDLMDKGKNIVGGVSLNQIGSAVLAGLPQISLLVETNVTPPIRLDLNSLLRASEGGPATPGTVQTPGGSGMLGLIRPRITVLMKEQPKLAYAPSGTPLPLFWPLVGLAGVGVFGGLYLLWRSGRG